MSDVLGKPKQKERFSRAPQTKMSYSPQSNAWLANEWLNRVLARTDVSIRLFEEKDREPARALLKTFHEETLFGHFPFSDRKFDRAADAVLQYPKHSVCLVAEHKNHIVGLIWATAGTYAFSDEGIIATCHVIAIDKERLSPIRRVKTFTQLLMAAKR